jgi:hypothetical protein
VLGFNQISHIDDGSFFSGDKEIFAFTDCDLLHEAETFLHSTLAGNNPVATVYGGRNLAAVS